MPINNTTQNKEELSEELIGNNDVYLLPPGVKRVYGYSENEKIRIKAMCITNDVEKAIQIAHQSGIEEERKRIRKK